MNRVSIYSMGTVFTQVYHNFWTSQVLWSRLKSAFRWQVKSSWVCSSRLPSFWGSF